MFCKVYKMLTTHLTKAIGALGSVLMTIAFIDPGPIKEAAATYLGSQPAAKVGTALFVIVILRGWYTGEKQKQAAQELAATQAALAAAHAKIGELGGQPPGGST